MAVLNVQDEFQSGDNVTATNLNNLVKDASFNADTTDNSTLEVHTSGYLKVKDLGVDTQHLADGAVETVKIGDDQVTYGKMQDVAANSVIGNPTTSSADPQAISISDLSSDIATELGNATTSADGLMSSTDKDKLDGIEENATANAGTVTEVDAGTGLETNPAGGITDTGTISISTGGVNTTQLANNAVTAAKITDTDTTFNIDSSGNVGVGIAPDPNTNTHIAKLHVAGTGNTFLAVKSDTFAAIDLEDSGAGTNQKHWQMGSLSGSYEIRKMDDDLLNFTTPFTIDNNGDLIIIGDIKKGGSNYALRKYSTGWQSSIGGTTLGNGNALTINHQLGTDDIVVTVYASNALQTAIYRVDGFTTGTSDYGADVVDIDSNNVYLQLAQNGIVWIDSNGNYAGNNDNWGSGNAARIKVVVTG